MKILISLFAMILILHSCTVSMTMMASKGSTDTLEEAQTNSPEIDPTIPISPLP